MEEIFNKILSELQHTNDRLGNMDKSQKKIFITLDKLEKGQEELTEGQEVINSRLVSMEKGQEELTEGQEVINSRLASLEKGQEELTVGQEIINSRLASMEKGQEELTVGQEVINNRLVSMEKGQGELTSGLNDVKTSQREFTGCLENIEKGQDEIRELMKHTTTLITENFTSIRKDMRAFALDVKADVELLFSEVAGVKRKVNKLEQSKK